MIEMQWVAIEGSFKDDVRITDSYGTVYKLQFREVVRRAPELGASIITATPWQDVKLASAEGGK